MMSSAPSSLPRRYGSLRGRPPRGFERLADAHAPVLADKQRAGASAVYEEKRNHAPDITEIE